VWRIADSPLLESTSNLRSVVAVDATHAWAVGGERYSSAAPDTSGAPVIERWDGQAWHREPLPDLKWPGFLHYVAADSPTNVWAVGSHTGSSLQDTVTRVLRFDGTGWREVPFPIGGNPGSVLITGLAVTGSHVWVVGNKGAAVVLQEWDGKAWHARQPPTRCLGGIPTYCTFTGITAFAPNDIWAAGNGSWSGFEGALLFHWNGSDWQTVDIGSNGHQFSMNAVHGRPPSDLWAVGNLFNAGTPYVVHGDGRSWKVVGGLTDGLVPSVAVDSANRPWLVRNDQSGNALLTTFAAGAWADTRAPRPPDAVRMHLETITAVPGTDRMFAVGYVDLPAESPLMRAIIVEYVTVGPTVSPSTDGRV
jgi:hypothetical protein